MSTPLLSLFGFLILTAAAIYYRHRPEVHKRLMLLAVVSIIDAAVSRWPIAWMRTPTAFLLLTDAFLVVAIVYDLVSRRRVHPAYVWGGAFLIFEQISRSVVGHTAVWLSFARFLIS